MTSRSFSRTAGIALVLLFVLGVGHLLALTMLFAPFLLMASSAHYGSAGPLLLLVPTLLTALAAMIYALFELTRWGALGAVPGRDDPLSAWQQVALWGGASFWLLWALGSTRLLVGLAGLVEARPAAAPLLMLPTFGIFFGVTVGALVILVLLGRLRPSGRRESGTRARSS